MIKFNKTILMKSSKGLTNDELQQSGVYMLYWDNNDFYYIGRSNHLDKRIQSHYNFLNKGKHGNTYIQNISDKYGLPNVKVLDNCLPCQAYGLEKDYLDKIPNRFNSLNISYESENLFNSHNYKAKMSLYDTAFALMDNKATSVLNRPQIQMF